MTQQPPELPTTATLIVRECARIRSLLLQKNKRYGDSAINPLRVFSTAPTLEQIKVRIDDKLSRILTDTQNRLNNPDAQPEADPEDDEDTELDLIGYLILLRIKRHLLQLTADATSPGQTPCPLPPGYWPDALEDQGTTNNAFPKPRPLEHDGELLNPTPAQAPVPDDLDPCGIRPSAAVELICDDGPRAKYCCGSV